MEKARLLTLLEPHAQRLGIRVDGSPRDVFGMIEAAHASAGVPYGALVALKMIYAGSSDTADMVANKWAHEYAAELAKGKRARRLWNLSGSKAKRSFPRVVDSAWYRVINPPLCPACLGRAFHQRGDQFIQCDRCLGQGTGMPPERILRKIAGVSPHEWKSRWEIVHEDLHVSMWSKLHEYLKEMAARAK